ncbi:MAG: VOC family protein [Pseudomonadota bacterium]
MIKDIHSAGLNVVDLEASIAFYCTGDAYELVEYFDISNDGETQAAFGLANPEGKGALLRGHAGFLELVQFDDSNIPSKDCRGVYDAGLRHICIRTRDANALFDQLKEAGSGWHARPRGLGTGIDYAYIRDPEGNLLELEGLPMMPPGAMKPWFDHAAIVTHDIERLAAFYEMLTGYDVIKRESYGPEAKFDAVAGVEGIVFDGAWILFGLSRLEMWHYQNPKTSAKQAHSPNERGWGHLCLEVDDLDAEYERLTKAGVEFLGAIRTSNMGRSVFLRDTDGNLIKLLQISKTRPELCVENLSARPILKMVRDVGEKPRKGQPS